ncbi:MAG: hypothetical protein H6806_10245 [Planctomycetes bacterium]|nr:hypothetical protein [Planctomycetota bacterium]MCB9830125.1 hypothetical protein [Planctomycetota bacterium]MCB9899958.1 hypothetical protein [Planctomycetota bacterium]
MIQRRPLVAVVMAALLGLAPGGALMADDEAPKAPAAPEKPPEPVELPANAARDFDTKWNYGDPAATETAFREFLPAAREGDDPLYLAELLSQLARTHSLRGQFDKAHALLDEAEEVLAKGGDACAGASVARARILLERGRCWNSSGDPKRSVPVFAKSLEVAREAGSDFHALDAMHMLGIAAPPDEALAWNEKAIAAAEASKSARTQKWLGALYNNTGWTLFEKGEHAKALVYFERDAAWRKARGASDLISRWSAAKAKRVLGRVEEALAEQRELLAAYEAKGETDGFVFEEIGECLWTLDKHDEAKPWLAKGYEALIGIDWMRTGEWDRLVSLHTRGDVETPLPERPAKPAADGE